MGTRALGNPSVRCCTRAKEGREASPSKVADPALAAGQAPLTGWRDLRRFSKQTLFVLCQRQKSLPVPHAFASFLLLVQARFNSVLAATAAIRRPAADQFLQPPVPTTRLLRKQSENRTFGICREEIARRRRNQRHAIRCRLHLDRAFSFRASHFSKAFLLFPSSSIPLSLPLNTLYPTSVAHRKTAPVRLRFTVSILSIFHFVFARLCTAERRRQPEGRS